MEMKSFVLFLAGGKWQVPWISYLKRKGHHIILVDPNENPPAKKYCDILLRFDVKDTECIRDHVENLGMTIDFVTSDQTDVATIPVAKLSAHFGTPHNTLEVVQRFTNKYLSRKFVKKQFGADHLPQFRKVKSVAELDVFLQQTNKPLIVKPADAQSSRGIFMLSAEAKAKEFEEEFFSSMAAGQSDYLIAEEFVSGREITIEGIMANNNHKTLAASGKTHFRMGIASNLNYPLRIEQGFQKEIFAFHNALLEATGLTFGITHCEYIIDEDKRTFYLVEMACRGGGTLIPSDIVPWVSGVNVYDIFYDQLLGIDAEATHQGQTNKNKAAKLHFFEFKPGKVQSIYGVEKALEIPGVHRLEFEFKAGDEIYAAADDRGRQGFVIILAESDAEIDDILCQVYETVGVEYERKSELKYLTSTGS